MQVSTHLTLPWSNDPSNDGFSEPVPSLSKGRGRNRLPIGKVISRGELKKNQSARQGIYAETWPNKKLVIEVDGKVHGFQKGYDQHRDDILNSPGLIVLRIKNGEFTDSFEVLKQIQEYIRFGLVCFLWPSPDPTIHLSMASLNLSPPFRKGGAEIAFRQERRFWGEDYSSLKDLLIENNSVNPKPYSLHEVDYMLKLPLTALMNI